MQCIIQIFYFEETIEISTKHLIDLADQKTGHAWVQKTEYQ